MSFLNLRENYDRIILIFARSVEQFLLLEKILNIDSPLSIILSTDGFPRFKRGSKRAE